MTTFILYSLIALSLAIFVVNVKCYITVINLEDNIKILIDKVINLKQEISNDRFDTSAKLKVIGENVNIIDKQMYKIHKNVIMNQKYIQCNAVKLANFIRDVNEINSKNKAENSLDTNTSNTLLHKKKFMKNKLKTAKYDNTLAHPKNK